MSFSNAWKWKVKVKSLSRVRLLATPWTADYQAPQSMGFFQSRVLEWSAIASSRSLEFSRESAKEGQQFPFICYNFWVPKLRKHHEWSTQIVTKHSYPVWWNKICILRHDKINSNMKIYFWTWPFPPSLICSVSALYIKLNSSMMLVYCLLENIYYYFFFLLLTSNGNFFLIKIAIFPNSIGDHDDFLLAFYVLIWTIYIWWSLCKISELHLDVKLFVSKWIWLCLWLLKNRTVGDFESLSLRLYCSGWLEIHFSFFFFFFFLTCLFQLYWLCQPLTVWITINCGKFWKRWE